MDWSRALLEDFVELCRLAKNKIDLGTHLFSILFHFLTSSHLIAPKSKRLCSPHIPVMLCILFYHLSIVPSFLGWLLHKIVVRQPPKAMISFIFFTLYCLIWLPKGREIVWPRLLLPLPLPSSASCLTTIWLQLISLPLGHPQTRPGTYTHTHRKRSQIPLAQQKEMALLHCLIAGCTLDSFSHPYNHCMCDIGPF